MFSLLPPPPPHVFPLISQASEGKDYQTFPISTVCRVTHVLNYWDQKLQAPFGLVMAGWLALLSVEYEPWLPQ